MNEKIFYKENFCNHKRRKNSMKVNPGERPNNYGDQLRDSNDINSTKNKKVIHIEFII